MPPKKAPAKKPAAPVKKAGAAAAKGAPAKGGAAAKPVIKQAGQCIYPVVNIMLN